MPNKTNFPPAIRIPVKKSDFSVDSRPPYLSLNLFIHTMSVQPSVQSMRVMYAADMSRKSAQSPTQPPVLSTLPL